MHNYSENWRHLKSILDGYATTNRRPELYSYRDHTQAKSLSIFLAHANLATPKLDRTTVEAVLAGRKTWPNILDMPQFEGISLPLSLLEEYGLVAFYAGWCTVHCQTLRSPDNVDPSLIQLIQAVQHLKDICAGRNGYIQPHYTCPADKLVRLLAAHFGSASVVELLPELCLKDDHFKLPPGNQNVSSLVSTYLWHTLRETFEPKEAFERWMLCLRVNCDWAMPVLLDDGNYQQRIDFNNQLLAYLAQDTGLILPTDTLWRQSINKDSFSNIVAPVSTHLQVTIDTEGSSSSKHEDIIELEKPTLATLSSAYPLPGTDDSNGLQFVQRWQRSGRCREPELFYTWLLASTIEASIRIDGQVLESSDFAEAVLELATSRPILKHLLFNLLPDYESGTYKIFLLSRPATCDIALFYLTQQSFSNSHRGRQSFTQHFDKGYQQLVCHEYLRTIEGEPDSGNHLLRAVELLGDRCALHTSDFSKSLEYQFLFCLLASLSPQLVIQLGQAFAQHPTASEKTLGDTPPQHYWYLLGFWLIERLEDTGIDQTGTLSHSLKIAVLNYYKAEFAENLAGQQCSLQPNAFFAAVPWHKLSGYEGVSPLLALSHVCSTWQNSLNHTNKHSFSAAYAVRHYLQVLICLGRLLNAPNDRERVADRVAEIVRTLGFGPRDQTIYLFNGALYADQYDLWTPFCSYTNLFQDSLFDDFVERCVPLIPLDQLFVLLERCTVIVRAQKLRDAIANRRSPEAEDLGLSSLERAFISACDSGHTVLATKLITAAKNILSQERFASTKNPHILRVRKVWLSYEYKWQLMDLFETSKHHPGRFAEAARKLPLPHEHRDKSYQEDGRVHWQECERFRRYIIAAAYCNSDPKMCVGIMEALYQETKQSIHSFLLFKARVALHQNGGDATRLRPVLAQFLGSLGDTKPEHMPTPWVATILDTYRQLHDDPEIDAFWMKLNPDQRDRVEILHPYCKALIARGEALIAQQIINRYREMNQQTSDGFGLNDLIDELCKALPRELSMSQLVQMINEESQRSAVQLAKHYSQIVSKEFEDYVTIVGQGKLPHEFLKNVVLEVAQELLLRKKNLQLHSMNSSGKTIVRITQEDLINDWFTSLFDKRMAEARIGFRDQKRGGQSESGKSPGEIDGYITDAKNKRIAIFEAFRLFSLNTTVISEHLNKIAAYDNESLSPVFIAAYCDVSDFDALVRGYATFIDNRNYAGFTFAPDASSPVETLHDTTDLWLGMERRRRNHREIIFYHLLLNMN